MEINNFTPENMPNFITETVTQEQVAEAVRVLASWQAQNAEKRAVFCGAIEIDEEREKDYSVTSDGIIAGTRKNLLRVFQTLINRSDPAKSFVKEILVDAAIQNA